MAQSSFPFENVDTTETEFSQMFRTLNAGVNGAPTGTELKVTAGTGLQVLVGAGQAMVRGHYYISTASEALTISTASGSNPRIDSIVLKLDPSSNSVVLEVVTGTPASTPVAPTLTQTDAGVYQYQLATVLVPTSATSVSTITDTRSFMGSRFGIWSTAGRPTSPYTGQAGYNTTIPQPEYWNGSAWTSFSAAPTSISSAIVTTAISDKSANYIIVSGDKNTYIRSTGSAITVTLDNVLSIGESINFIQAGAGQITFAAGTGVTLYSADSLVKTAKQYAGATVVCGASGIYYLIGNLG
jgi:hypothetical protein